MDHIVFDIETQHEFSEVGGRDYPHLLKVSVVCCYSYAQDKFLEFEEKGMGRIITKKPIIPTEDEIEGNKRARSAKLRIFSAKGGSALG